MVSRATAIFWLAFASSQQFSKAISLYTYALPKAFTEDVALMPLNRTLEPWSIWYDTDQELHPYLKAHSVQDESQIEDSTLFFIPVYTAQLYHSLLIDQRLSHADSINRTAEAVRRALTWVKITFPYWNRTNGLDHFMVMPLDHGRCSSMAGLSHDDFGDMFSIQASGDHVLSDFESHRWKCYNPQRDIVIPIRTEARFTVNDTIRPLDTERNISILYRFVGGGRGDYGILRSRLLAKQLGDPIPGGVSGWQTVNGTHDDMTHSIFCVCPPGIAQHTLRVWRSIMFGCIPITFFNANDNPYTFSRLDYSKFSINIDPTEWYLLQPIIKGLLARPERIALMQEELAKIQTRFVWDSENFSGAFQAVFEELALHPSRFVSLSLSE